MKKIISFMLTIILVVGMLPISAVAASTPEEALGEVNIYSGGYSMNYLAVNGKVQTQSYTYFLYRNSQGETQEIPAYCVNPNQYGVPAPTSTSRCASTARGQIQDIICQLHNEE